MGRAGRGARGGCPLTKPVKAIACDYCGNPAELVGGDVVYPRMPWLADKKIWRCEPCGAWVGCHQGTTNALGRLANAELRKAKMAAHAAFDPLWKERVRRTGCGKKVARSAAYKWLAAQLGIPREECHVGMMDVDRCRRVVEVCAPYAERFAA